jgi:Ca2+-transporting ATPase
MLVAAISLAVAAVPESLPAVVTLALALGARRMAAEHAIVRRLPSVETLGSITILATDKTGTLTRGEMAVELVWTPHHLVHVNVLGDSSGTVFHCGGSSLDVSLAPDLLELLEAGVLCNDARLLQPSSGTGPLQGLGDPTEVALLVVAHAAGVHREDLERAYPRIAEVPFDSGLKMMTTVHSLGGAATSRAVVIRKGSLEALAAHADAEGVSRWETAMQVASQLSSEGYRVLGATTSEVRVADGHVSGKQRLLGLFAMADPAKPEAATTIGNCIRAGIRPVMITGDHPGTAAAVARKVGILSSSEADPGQVIVGNAADPGGLTDPAAASVFARTNPAEKLRLVRAWQQRDEIVAMIGDGVNDGPALRQADIGVAMGNRGTDVARQAADLVLADDELRTLVSAVREGRRIYSNIRRFLAFALSGGVAELLIMLIGPLTGLPLPLTAAQILWVNLLTHGITGVAFGAEPPAPGAMQGPPRSPTEAVLGKGLWQLIAVVGSIVALVTLVTGWWARSLDGPWQTMVFVSLTSLQFGVALGLRPKPASRENPFLPVSIAISFMLLLAAVYLPFLREILGTVSLSATHLGISVSMVLAGGLVARVTAVARARRSDLVPFRRRDHGHTFQT